MDTRGQCRFLGMVGLTGSYLFTELDRFMQNQMRYADMARKVREDDWEGQTKKRSKHTWTGCARSRWVVDAGLLTCRARAVTVCV